MNKKHIYFFTLGITLIFLLSTATASAAALSIFPPQQNLALGESFSIDIKIDSEGESINAAQAMVSWPANVLQFVGVDKTGSVFNFWVDEPTLSGASSSLRFIGGTAKGVSGGTLQILRLKFIAKSADASEITLSDAAITSSNGEGTNILSKLSGAAYRVGTSITQPEVPQPIVTAAKQSIPQPVIVERKAIPAKDLPQKPIIQVPLYANSAQWNNILGAPTVLWQVPNDILTVAASLDHSPNTVPREEEKELATGKRFGILSEGIWYVHVRFKNNVGWGPVGHYRIALDTTPPLPFELLFSENLSTDNPAPALQFRTSDELSGLKEYQVRIDEVDALHLPAATFTGHLTLPLQNPGMHHLTVNAFDEAGNSVEDDLTFEIIPIPSPVFTSVAKEIFTDAEQGLTVKGIAVPSTQIALQLIALDEQENGQVVASAFAEVDEKGNWESMFTEPLRNGDYIITAQLKDARGALSLVAQSEKIHVAPKPIIQIGPLALGKGGAALFLLVILIAGIIMGIIVYDRRKKKIALRVGFAGSEMTKIFTLLNNDVDRLTQALETPTPADDEYTLDRLKYNLKKMETYLHKGIEKIKR